MITTPSSSASFSEAVGDGAGEGIGKIKAIRVLDGAEIRGEEKLLGGDDVRAVRRCLADEPFVVVEGCSFIREGAGLE